MKLSIAILPMLLASVSAHGLREDKRSQNVRRAKKSGSGKDTQGETEALEGGGCPGECVICDKNDENNKDRPEYLKLKYHTGVGEISKYQDEDKATCRDQTFPTSDTVTIYDMDYPVEDGTMIMLSASDTDKGKFDAETDFFFGSDSGLECFIHTSCSQPLVRGDRIGPWEIMGGTGCEECDSVAAVEVASPPPTLRPTPQPTPQPTPTPTPGPTPQPTPSPTSQPTKAPVTNAPTPPAPLISALREDECLDSHVGIGTSPYPSLYGWRYMVTESGSFTCPDGFDLGWEKDGKFDSLAIFRDGVQVAEYGTCPTDFPAQAGDFLVFYTDNSHEYPGFTLCLNTDSGSVGGLMAAPPEDNILQGACFVSHPEYDGNNSYYKYYGYGFEIMKDGCMTAETFNVRDGYSKLYLLEDENDVNPEMWTGTVGPDNTPVSAGNIIKWNVDDAGIQDQNIGYKICFNDCSA